MTSYFWLVCMHKVGKREGRTDYIYDIHKKEWEADDAHYISDSLMGYDSSEEAGSPYGIGNMDIMGRCEEITEDKAMRIMNRVSKGGEIDMNYQKALDYATLKHAGQTRIEGTEYIAHPIAVAKILRDKGFGIDVQIMGLFHDLLEDTNATDKEIIALSNQEVLDVVKLLSKEEHYDMDEYISRISSNQKATAVKLADRIHNLQCATVADEAFRKKYFIESIDHYMDLAEQPFYINGAFDTLFKSDFQTALDDLYDTFHNEFYCESCKRFLCTEEKSEVSEDHDWGICRACAE